MNSFWKRTLTALVFVAILIGCTFNDILGSILFLVICMLASTEFYMLAEKKDANVARKCGVLLSGLLYISFTSPFLIEICGIFPIVMLTYELFRNKGNAFENWAYLVMGQIFIALPFAMLNILTMNFHYKEIIWALFIAIWANDTCAYLCGCTLGKHKFFERISPKKSWEGFIGGAVISIALCTFLIPYLDASFSTWKAFGFAVVAVTAGTFGDLIESLLKRSVGVKDSGNLLPGHGGILDRFDSFILAIPAVYIYMQIWDFVNLFFL